VARKTPVTSLKQISEINLTPLMDLTFILLITFIITFPLIEQGIPINVPRGKAETLTQEDASTISVDEEGRLYLDDALVTAEQLDERMQALGKADPHTRVLVRADESIPYAKVVRVLRILHGARITKMALVTRSDETPEP
jgi:biopolymer transport protein TolR